VDNAVLGNAIFANGGLGIDLTGTTANDADDADEGANRGQNYPDIGSASLEANGDMTVTYLVDTAPANATYPLRIDFYRADATGQGMDWLGSDAYSEDDFNGAGHSAKTAMASKTATFTPVTVTPALTVIDQIVATATDANGNTSEFTNTPMLLPVELIAFEALRDGDTVHLTWETASETNNAGFEIQRISKNVEADGHPPDVWQILDFVEGYGTTDEAQTYSYRVDELAPGTHRFRLKQIDYDGTHEYSPEVEVAVGVAGTYRMSAAYPNPFNPQTSFSLAVARAQQVEIAVYDVLGRRVEVLFDGEMAANQSRAFVWKARDRPSGLYFIRVIGERFAETRQVTLVK
jgi:hypothetical protein